MGLGRPSGDQKHRILGFNIQTVYVSGYFNAETPRSDWINSSGWRNQTLVFDWVNLGCQLTIGKLQLRFQLVNVCVCFDNSSPRTHPNYQGS